MGRAVTTGSRFNGNLPDAHDFINVGFWKTWNGGDGKTELADGRKRSKWNDYSMSVSSRLRPQNHWDVYSRYVGPPPSQPLWHDGEELFGVSHVVNPDINRPRFESNDQLRLLSKLNEKVKGHQFNLGVNLGELKELVPMVSDNLLKLAKSFRALKHGDFATAARQLGASKKTTRLKSTDISGRWLELQYGWLPTLSDIHEGAKAFEALSNGPRTSIVRASVTKRNRFNGSTSPSHHQAMVDAKITRYIMYEMTEELSAPRQLGLTDPLTIAWELLPLSFVVDWSLPIGLYLENLGTTPFLKGRFLQTTVTRYNGFSDIKWTMDPHDRWGPNWFTYVVPPFPDTDTLRSTVMERKVLGSLEVPFPSFVKGNEIFKNATRVFNAIGLLHQAFSGGTIKFR